MGARLATDLDWADLTARILALTEGETDAVALMATVGALSGIGQYLLIEAFQKVPASSLAPFNYFHLLLAVVFSVLVFGQRPDAIALLGIAVIGCAGLALTLPVFRAQWLAILAARQAHR